MRILLCFGFNVGYGTLLGIGNRSILLILNCNAKIWCYLMLNKATIWCYNATDPSGNAPHWCGSHTSPTATCEQSWPKPREGKDQASDGHKSLPCTWKWEVSLADSSGAELTLMTLHSILPEVQGWIPHWSRTQQPGSSASLVKLC